MDRSEFENKVLPLGRNLYRFAFRFLANTEDAEDAVQEVCVKLWNMRDKLDKYRSIEAFAMTMTRNHCLDKLRKKGREIFEDTRPVDTRADGQDPQIQMDRKEAYMHVLQIVKDLPQKYQTVLQMRDIDGCDYDEIEKSLGENINTIRVNLSRARKMVREKLKLINYEPARTG